MASEAKLTRLQWRIVHGLLICGHAEISASEWPEVAALKDAGIVEIYGAMGGCAAWRLTPFGREQAERVNGVLVHA